MLILVPAPMTKRPPVAGDPVDLAELSFPELTETRESVLDALGEPRVRVGPAAPARSLYGGVLLDTLGLRADDPVVLISALWGAVRPGDRLPEYRLDFCDHVPGIEKLVTYWREPMSGIELDDFVVDLRSTEYLDVWHPPDLERWVSIKPVRDRTFERGSGGSTVRRTRGLVARAAIESGARDPGELAAALSASFEVQLRPPPGPRSAYELRVVSP